MRVTQRKDSDPVLFCLIAVNLALLFSALMWYGPKLSPDYSLRNSLFLAPALACIAAALGVPWTRKAVYFGMTFVGFVLIDLIGATTGVLELAADIRSWGADPARFLLTVVYQTFVMVYPLVLMVFFVGARPSVMWTRPAGRSRRS
jgi:hypothetical protein